MEEDDKGWPTIRMGLSAWVFLLVPAYPGFPDQRPLNSCVCVCFVITFSNTLVYGQFFAKLRCLYCFIHSFLVSFSFVLLVTSQLLLTHLLLSHRYGYWLCNIFAICYSFVVLCLLSYIWFAIFSATYQLAHALLHHTASEQYSCLNLTTFATFLLLTCSVTLRFLVSSPCACFSRQWHSAESR